MDIAVFAWLTIGAVIAAMLYWAFIAPARARRRRREANRSFTQTGAWDVRIYSGRRNR